MEARLAACAQADGPVTSVYRWAGAVQTDKEWRVTFKTTAALADRLTEYIVRVHSYDVPEVLVTPVIGGHQKYLEWVQSETQQEWSCAWSTRGSHKRCAGPRSGSNGDNLFEKLRR